MAGGQGPVGAGKTGKDRRSSRDPEARGADKNAQGGADYHGHRERLRQRFLKGPAAIADYELLEMILFGARTRGDTKPLAKALLRHFGTLAAVLAAPPERLAEVPGAGSPAISATLALCREAATRLVRTEILRRPVIASWQALLDYCQITMSETPVEQFRILFLDRKNAVMADEVQQQGTVDHTPVYPREVLKRALALGASALIMIHNHPSGDPTPSRADIEMTKEIRDAAKAVGIRLHDHLVIGRGRHASFKSLGLL